MLRQHLIETCIETLNWLPQVFRSMSLATWRAGGSRTTGELQL